MQAIYNIPEICAAHQIKHAILSPGSRNAPISIAFSRNEKIKSTTIIDERSAGYIALGIAESTREAVVLCCTSGTAVANYYPAIIEAFYQHIPLVIITADRPPEWVDEGDGQSIRQANIYSNHIIKSFNLLPDNEHKDSDWFIQRSMSEAIQTAQIERGPVHINIPLREPFYPSSIEETKPKNVRIIKKLPTESVLAAEGLLFVTGEMRYYEKILVVVGQSSGSKTLTEHLNLQNIPVIAECTANIYSEANIIKYHDVILNKNNDTAFEALKPDLLISVGEQFISKNLKTFLRSNPPTEHWHIGTEKNVADVFQCLTKIISVEPEYFFKHIPYEAISNEYLADWLFENNKAKLYTKLFLDTSEFSEFQAVHKIIPHIPSRSLVHYGNSMSIRYGNHLPIDESKKVKVYSNRGASGIDGSLSTAVGHAITNPDIINTIILGDLSFFYDRNALWNNLSLNNLRIIVLNNHGGGIFKMIPGPKRQPELESLFVTNQTLEAHHSAQDFDIDYQKCTSIDELENALGNFYEPSLKAKIIEVVTDTDCNTKVYDLFRTLENYGK